MVYNELRLAALETVGRLAWDDENLYVAFECHDPNPSEIEIAPRDRDRHEPGDSVEVLVDAGRDRKSFVHYMLDLGGNVFDARRGAQADGLVKYDRNWDGNLDFGLNRVADRWTAELAIPIADLGRAPKLGDTWGIHIARNIHG